MPTLKPRVAVTLEPHTHEVIERLASLQGRSRGAVISELIDSVAPALARTVALLEAAASAPKQVQDGLRSVVEGLHSDLLETAGDSIKQLDWLLGDFQRSAQEANPHVVTRGSGQGNTGGAGTSKKPLNPAATRVPANKASSKGSGGLDAREKR